MSDQPEFVQQLREQLDNGRVSLDLRRATQRRVAGGVVVLALIAGLGAAALNLVSNDPPPSTVDVAGNDDLEDRGGPEQSLANTTTTVTAPTTTPTTLPPSTSTTTATPTADGRGDLQSPLENFFGLITDPWLLSEAMNNAVLGYRADFNACIALAGWPQWQDTGTEPAILPTQFIGVQNAGDHLAELGYGVATSADIWIAYDEWQFELGVSDAQNEQYTERDQLADSLSPAESDNLEQALTQCDEQARNANPYPNRARAQIPRSWDLIQDAHGQAALDPAVIDAQMSWLICVQERGYAHASRPDAMRYLSSLIPELDSYELRVSGEWPTRLAEFRVIVEDLRMMEAELVAIDLECASTTRVDEITREVRFAIEDEIIATQRDLVEALRDG